MRILVTCIISVLFISLFASILFQIEKYKIRKKELNQDTIEKMSLWQKLYMEMKVKNKFINYPKINEYFSENYEALNTIIARENLQVKDINFVKAEKSYSEKIAEEVIKCYWEGDKDVLNIFELNSKIIDQIIQLKSPMKYIIISLKKILLLKILSFLAKICKILINKGKNKDKFNVKVYNFLKNRKKALLYK